MGTIFKTKSLQNALDYIRIHMDEGYFVTVYKGRGSYYWEDVYKICVTVLNKEDKEDE